MVEKKKKERNKKIVWISYDFMNIFMVLVDSELLISLECILIVKNETV